MQQYKSYLNHFCKILVVLKPRNLSWVSHFPTFRTKTKFFLVGNSKWYDFHTILMGQQVNRNDWDIWAASGVKSFLKESFIMHSDNKSSNIKKNISWKKQVHENGSLRNIFTPYCVKNICCSYNSGPTSPYFGRLVNPIPISGGGRLCQPIILSPPKF